VTNYLSLYSSSVINASKIRPVRSLVKRLNLLNPDLLKPVSSSWFMLYSVVVMFMPDSGIEMIFILRFWTVNAAELLKASQRLARHTWLFIFLVRVLPRL
jgi:hypothetical protein